jgi:hypothetical protein
MQDLPQELEMRVFTEISASLERGKAARRATIFWSTVTLAIVLVVLGAVFGASDYFAVAIAVAAGTLCIVWAVMSASASLNLQCDTLATMLTYYAEQNRKAQSS